MLKQSIVEQYIVEQYIVEYSMVQQYIVKRIIIYNKEDLNLSLFRLGVLGCAVEFKKITVTTIGTFVRNGLP